MKISLNWLRDYVDYEGTPDALADLLTMAGVEVEGIETRGVNVDKVVVAQILSSEQHPDADRLSVCRVDDGSGQETPRQIVCGAKNFKAGDKVPLALPGAELPGGVRIKVGKLRGVESEGMLCSGKELGISTDAAGLLILSPDAPVGAPIGELFPGDTILDLEITPNRPDLLSHVGLAREVAALTGRTFRWPGAAEWRESTLAAVGEADEEFSVTLAPEAAAACPFYSAQVLSGVTVGPSPDWLRGRLEAVGLRSINNVVDVTNYVLLEMGQPLHAFDLGKVPTKGLEPRMARENEEFLALDGKNYKLAPHQLVIAEKDGGPALALAGVMGGEDSGVTAQTRDIVLESAYFAPAGIRRTSRELGLASDSSHRFERGVDPGAVADASLRAVQLIQQVAGGETRGLYAAQAKNFADKAAGGQIVMLRPLATRRVLGMDILPARVTEILTGFGLISAGGNPALWHVPSYRGDLTREIDLIEELSRVVGLDQTPSRARGYFAPISTVDREYDFQMALRRRLAGLGFAETRSLSLVSEAAAGADGGVRLKNPLSEEYALLRGSLLPSLLATAGRNARLGTTDLRLFELGRVFSPEMSAARPEPMRLALFITGNALPHSWQHTAGESVNFHDLCGVIERLTEGGKLDFKPADACDGFALSADVLLDGATIGQIGQLAPSRAKSLDLRASALVAELELAPLHKLASAERRFVPMARFPSVTRDLAAVVDDSLPHGKLVSVLRGVGEPLLADVQLFDIFTDDKGEKILLGKKSLAYSLTFRADDRTLKTEEVNAAHARLKTALQAAFDGIQFRE